MLIKVEVRITEEDGQDSPDRILSVLEAIAKEQAALRSLVRKGFVEIVKRQEELKELWQQADEATTAIGERLEQLIEKVSEGTVDESDIEEGRAIVARLKAFATTDTVEPVPPGEPITPPSEGEEGGTA
jgi:hypothetical protein